MLMTIFLEVRLWSWYIYCENENMRHRFLKRKVNAKASVYYLVWWNKGGIPCTKFGQVGAKTGGTQFPHWNENKVPPPPFQCQFRPIKFSIYTHYTSTTPPQLIYKIYIYTRYSWNEKNLVFFKVIFSGFFSFWPILNLLQGIVGSVEGVGRIEPGNILLFLLLLFKLSLLNIR